MKARYSVVFVAVFAAIALLCAVREAAAAEAKSVIFQGSGLIVEVHVPPQFVARLDELETIRNVYESQGSINAERMFHFWFDPHPAARTQIVGLEERPDNVRRYTVQATREDFRKFETIIRSDYEKYCIPLLPVWNSPLKTLADPPPRLQRQYRRV